MFTRCSPNYLRFYSEVEAELRPNLDSAHFQTLNCDKLRKISKCFKNILITCAIANVARIWHSDVDCVVHAGQSKHKARELDVAILRWVEFQQHLRINTGTHK